MIRTLIVENDLSTRQQLLACLAKEADIEVVAECLDCEQVMDRLETFRPDVVFVDAEAPNVPRLEALLPQITGKLPYLIVVAASDKYAVQAFAANAVDYLLCPLDDARLKKALRKLRRILESDSHLDKRLDIDTLVDCLRKYSANFHPERQDDRIPINFGGRFRFISVKAIRCVKADADYVDIHLITGEILHSTNRISEMMSKLPADRFLRIRRSVIVSVAHIREARAHKDNYEIVMDNGEAFRPGTTYKFKVRAALVKGSGANSSVAPL